VSPRAELGAARADAWAVTDPTVISPPKSETPETWTVASAAVELLPAAPLTVEETEAALAIDPSPGNAKPPLDDRFGGPVTAPAVPPPAPGIETEIPNASALGVPAFVAEGAPVEPVSASIASRPSRSERRFAMSSD
jgi:hypothetical protein